VKPVVRIALVLPAALALVGVLAGSAAGRSPAAPAAPAAPAGPPAPAAAAAASGTAQVTVPHALVGRVRGWPSVVRPGERLEVVVPVWLAGREPRTVARGRAVGARLDCGGDTMLPAGQVARLRCTLTVLESAHGQVTAALRLSGHDGVRLLDLPKVRVRTAG
jgi:hypothetical protein